ncbi:hypothetical protein CROQUDRAFT_660272 [Cronartium quercuum f. sp. fusiforme G11]|uniref:GTP-binding protein n=1 Tax=Cronartium quercuum f. sp. fusiforme G11 TaxID=708437 RepID=A0A9P6T9H9_9BASI|nr:hypothetical protein CROQUDRAFT_660272 [Cronartium quercuum f. sp. fusiforme G11]
MAQNDSSKKVLLMGKSGSGKSSMRNIIFANMAAADTRKLGATIELETTSIKFLGHFGLRLVDCGGQDSYMSGFLSLPAVNRRSVFSQLSCLLYVFDVESPEFSRVDMIWFSRVISAIIEILDHQPDSMKEFKLHILIHKMDLVAETNRNLIFEKKSNEILNKIQVYSKGKINENMIKIFGTSIWDETIYKAWSTIVQTLIPEISSLNEPLKQFTKLCCATEVIVFELSTSLVVARWTELDKTNKKNKIDERRFERTSAIVKAFKSTSSKIRSPFKSMEISHPMYTAVLDRLTDTTAILVVAIDPQVVPAAIHLNIDLSRSSFSKLPGLSMSK